MIQHTPGPWTPFGDTGLVTSGVNRTHIATVAMQGLRFAGPANARLIAAAPDMLTALQNILDAHDAGEVGEYHDALMEARAAVAKALWKDAS